MQDLVLSLTVFGTVLAVTAVIGVLGYLIDRSAGHEGEGR